MDDNTWLLALQGIDPNNQEAVQKYQMDYLKSNVPPEQWAEAVAKGWISPEGKPLNIPGLNLPQGSDGGQWDSASNKYISNNLATTQGWKPTNQTYNDPVYGQYNYFGKPDTLDKGFWQAAPFAAALPGILGSAAGAAGLIPGAGLTEGTMASTLSGGFDTAAGLTTGTGVGESVSGLYPGVEIGRAHV